MHMRVGEAYVGLGAADTALIYLSMAEFLEYRPYYIGRVLVAIGNAYDLLRMRDQAVAYYKRVLETPTSYPSRVEARRYLKEPFKPGRA
jgi:tetratricopeptide (TPR) repeat protein